MRIQIPCSTSNLGPGFDTLGLALNRYLTLDVTLSEKKSPKKNSSEVSPGHSPNDAVTITVEGYGKDHIATDETNLVFAAAKFTAEKLGKNLPAFHLHLRNDIPAYGGLGGSGAAIAGGVFLADRILNGGMSKEEMLNCAVAIEGHPDNVSAAIYGGLTVNCYDARRNVHCRSIPVTVPLSVITCSPHFQVQTKHARKILPQLIPLQDAVANIENAASLVAALISGDTEALRYATADRLHEQYRATLIPGFGDVKDAALAAGAISVNISGAGPTVFAFAADNGTRIAEAMSEAFHRNGQTASSEVMSVENNGIQIL